MSAPAGAEDKVAVSPLVICRVTGAAAYAAAVETLGLPQLFELLTLVGYYDTLALQLRVFRVPAPDA